MTKAETIVGTAVPVASEGETPKGKVEKKGGKRIGYNYIILKSLKESPKNDVVKCIYIKSLTDFGICVIKEGTAGELKDKDGRDIKDRLIWQKELHELLGGKARVPRYIGSFEENGNYYLAIEHIRGKTLGNICKLHGKRLREGLLSGNKLGIRFIGYLLQIIDMLDTLHKQHIVHRDVTSANFIITPGGKVSIIDMELSYSLAKQAPAPPFQLGTHGYMSPQQLAVETPTINEDVFSIGAIILQLWTGIAPVKLTLGSIEELVDKVHFFIPDKGVADIVLQCLHPDAVNRPLLKDVYAVIKQFRSDLKNRIKREHLQPPLYSKDDMRITIQQVINTLATPLLADKERGWFAESLSEDNRKDKNDFQKDWYASFHVGVAGVLYALTKAHVAGFDIEGTKPHIYHALSLIEEKYIKRIENAMPGLYFGADGISACLTEAIQSGLINPSENYLAWISALLGKKTELPGMMWGVAGQGMANFTSMSAMDTNEAQLRLQEYVNYLLNRQDKNGAWLREPGGNNKNGRITRGFSNGIAGIVYFLLEYGQQFNDRKAIMGAEQGLQWLMKAAIKNKNIITWNSSEGKEVSPWWCDGGPGISLAFMKAYTSTGDLLYKEFATGALQCHLGKTLDNNLSQYNGLSGLGEIYLEAYRSLQDDHWLERAGWIAQVIMRLKKQHVKHGAYWLVEHEKQPVPGFMIGNAGVLHFLMRYCYPDKIGFPMMSGRAKNEKITGVRNEQLLIKDSQFF